jgi:hypothetical protein
MKTYGVKEVQLHALKMSLDIGVPDLIAETPSSQRISEGSGGGDDKEIRQIDVTTTASLYCIQATQLLPRAHTLTDC